jgi:hypothetical protein
MAWPDRSKSIGPDSPAAATSAPPGVANHVGFGLAVRMRLLIVSGSAVAGWVARVRPRRSPTWVLELCRPRGQRCWESPVAVLQNPPMVEALVEVEQHVRALSTMIV